MEIALSNGMYVPAAPGKYRMAFPPDLNRVTEQRFLLQYDFPFLLVSEMSTRTGSEKEKGEAVKQARLWEELHAGGNVNYDRGGYQFNRPSSSRSRGFYRQYIPDISYVDAGRWSRLSDEERNRAYVPCVPTVVIELMSGTDKMEKLQEKMSKFINAGTREGVIVDTRRNRIWIYNRNEQPYTVPLQEIVLDWWPDFTLDCVAIRDARTRAGLW